MRERQSGGFPDFFLSVTLPYLKLAFQCMALNSERLKGGLCTAHLLSKPRRSSRTAVMLPPRQGQYAFWLGKMKRSRNLGPGPS
ncbi:hypothetical protein BDZ89DRAFT_616526 [Hymenopellis radicata]|nr:hypothetical protein BDZ89DRAFT_616526 [Hymenopellis radicata]